MISPVFQNLNKIDSKIKEYYKVEFIFNESLSHYKFIVESNNVEMVILIDRNDLQQHLMSFNERFNWSYLPNPKDTKSSIKRQSTIDSIKEDIKTIFDKEMFNNAYLEGVKFDNLTSINESVESVVIDVIREDNDGDLIVNSALLKAIFTEYGIEVDFELNKHDGSYELTSDLSSVAYDGAIPTSTLIKLESDLKKNFDFVSINTNLYKVTLEIDTDMEVSLED